MQLPSRAERMEIQNVQAVVAQARVALHATGDAKDVTRTFASSRYRRRQLSGDVGVPTVSLPRETHRSGASI
jgi:hypothetical protein